MKIRTGFVSNSSSSSFVIGIARVKDIKSVEELISKTNMGYSAHISIYDEHTNLSVESFDSNVVGLDGTNLVYGDTILKIYYIGDEGDGYFSDGDNYGDLNYDIDFDDLSTNIVDLVDGLTPYVDNFDYAYGAGRNGW